jgi:hypothetical protein
MKVYCCRTALALWFAYKARCPKHLQRRLHSASVQSAAEKNKAEMAAKGEQNHRQSQHHSFERIASMKNVLCVCLHQQMKWVVLPAPKMYLVAQSRATKCSR